MKEHEKLYAIMYNKIEEEIKKAQKRIGNKTFLPKSFYCQRTEELESTCDTQCDHCKEYYKSLEDTYPTYSLLMQGISMPNYLSNSMTTPAMLQCTPIKYERGLNWMSLCRWLLTTVIVAAELLFYLYLGMNYLQYIFDDVIVMMCGYSVGGLIICTGLLGYQGELYKYTYEREEIKD